jgi:prepilin-type N-terminal cleavage/methylation domain-containing protein
MRRHSGFTLMELVLTMSIMVIVGALAAPMMFSSLYGDTKVTAGADMVRARWADCRAQALEESRPYRFAVVPNSGKFKVEPYQGSLENADTAFLNNDSSPNSPGVVIEDVLPEGVRFGTKDQPVDANSNEATGSDYVTIAIFLPDGSAQDDVEITFGAKGSTVVTLRLRAYTGSVTTIRKEEP